MLYHRNTFICVRSANEDLSHVMDIQGIPILLEGRQAERFTHCAMTVDFDHRNRRRSTRCREDKSCYIIALADLELLCPSLLIQYNLSGRKFHEYKFKISVHRPLDNSPRSSQFLHRLLEPFTILHSLSHFDIVCPTNRQYCTSIATQVSRPPPTQSEVVGTVAMFENTGYHHLARNDFQRAIKYYKLAFAQHMYPFCPQQRVMQPSDRPLHEQQDLIAETTCMLPAALSNAHFEAREYNDALYWAVLALANRPPGDDTPRKWEINAYLARLMVQASEALMGIEDGKGECRRLGLLWYV